MANLTLLHSHQTRSKTNIMKRVAQITVKIEGCFKINPDDFTFTEILVHRAPSTSFFLPFFFFFWPQSLPLLVSSSFGWKIKCKLTRVWTTEVMFPFLSGSKLTPCWMIRTNPPSIWHELDVTNGLIIEMYMMWIQLSPDAQFEQSCDNDVSQSTAWVMELNCLN